MKRAQDLIRELVKTEACLHAGKEADDARIKALEAEIESLRTEQRHESSVHSRRTASRGGVDDTKEEAEREDHRRARDLLASKLKEREGQLAALRHEAEENRKLAKDLEAGQKRIRSLEAEVGKMAAQSETLRARIKDDDVRFVREKTAHAEKLKQVKADADAKIAALEVAHTRQRKELVDARKALRTGGGRQYSEWLDSEMEKFLNRKQAMEELEQAVRKREEVVREKEALLRDQAALDLKRRRNNQQVVWARGQGGREGGREGEK